MINWYLFYEFFKIGLFSFGGGYATIPFLFHISEVYRWYSLKELSQMTAIASITPGPVGINVATYAGMKTSGILGALIATSSEMLPSLILVLLISKILKKYSDNYYVTNLIQILKPISCALLLSVAFGLLKLQINDIKSVLLLSLLLLLSWKSKKDPIFYIFISAIFAIVVDIIV